MIDYTFNPGDRVHLSTAIDARTGTGLVEFAGMPAIYRIDAITEVHDTSADAPEFAGPLAVLTDLESGGHIYGVNLKRLVPIGDQS